MTGFVLPILALGLGSISIKPQRGFYGTTLGNITAQVTLEETHIDTMEMTDHPVEFGSSVTDHAFNRPEEVIIKCAWSDSPSGGAGLVGSALALGAANSSPIRNALALGGVVNAVQSLMSGNGPSQAKAVYEQFLAIQKTRLPFSISTGKRQYKDMVFKALSVTTDKDSEHVLIITAVCRQIIIARTSAVQIPLNPKELANPQKHMPVANTGTKQLKPVAAFTGGGGKFDGRGASGDWNNGSGGASGDW